MGFPIHLRPQKISLFDERVDFGTSCDLFDNGRLSLRSEVDDHIIRLTLKKLFETFSEKDLLRIEDYWYRIPSEFITPTSGYLINALDEEVRRVERTDRHLRYMNFFWTREVLDVVMTPPQLNIDRIEVLPNHFNLLYSDEYMYDFS